MRLRDLDIILEENPDLAIEYVVLEYDDKTSVQKVVIGIKQEPSASPNLGQDIVKLMDDEHANEAVVVGMGT